ncbi:MAG: protein phosphatase 2C domain-containing protein [Myxococcota bacterium]
MAILFSAHTDVGRVREQNEDNYLVDRKLQLYLVCDGMGGHLSGEVASATAVNVVREQLLARREVLDAYVDDPTPESAFAVTETFAEAVETASARIYERGMLNPEQRGMGTTLTGLLLRGERGFLAHVGDSRIYRTRAGKLEQLTEDHSLYNAMLKSGAKLEGEEALGRLKNAVTRAVGVQSAVEVDTYEVELQSEDRFLLCSDGLTGYLDGDELRDVMQEPDNDLLVERLIAIANERGGRDNITAVIVELPPNSLEGALTPSDEAETELRRSALGNGLSSADAHAVRKRMKVMEFSAGTRIFEAGTRGREAYMVVSGALRLTAEGVSPRRVEVGEVIGEDYLLTGGYHMASLEVTAEGPATVASLDRAGYRGLARDTPVSFARLSLNLARQLSVRLGAAATALGDPLWRYRDPGEPATLANRRTAQTVDLEPAELEEIDMLTGSTSAGDASAPVEPPMLPDEEFDMGVGVLDTTPGIDLNTLRSDDPEGDPSV